MERLVAVRDLPTTLEMSSRAVHLHHTQHVHDELGYHKTCILGTKMSDRESQKSVFNCDNWMMLLVETDWIVCEVQSLSKTM